MQRQNATTLKIHKSSCLANMMGIKIRCMQGTKKDISEVSKTLKSLDDRVTVVQRVGNT